MALDLDDVLAYTTTRSVTVRHRWLGLTYYTLLALVLVYIFGIQIAWQRRDLTMLDVHGAIQANVYGPADLTPIEELGYCDRPYVNNRTFGCIYPSLATGILSKVGVGMEGSLFIGTRLSSIAQQHNRSCSDEYACAQWVPEPGTAAYTAAKHTSFVGDVERSTVRFVHRVSRDTEAAFGFSTPTFLTAFAPVEARSAVRMCLERDHARCVSPNRSYSPPGDVFTLEQLIRLADVLLDQPDPDEGDTSSRYDGLTMKVRVGYSSPSAYAYYLSVNELSFATTFVAPDGATASTRTLYDVHGLQLLLSHDGQLGRFELRQLLLALVTGVGLFSLAKVATDALLMYCLPKRQAYRLFVQDVTPDFSPSSEEERAVLETVLRAKLGERSFLQGGRPAAPDGARTAMLQPTVEPIVTHTAYAPVQPRGAIQAVDAGAISGAYAPPPGATERQAAPTSSPTQWASVD